MTWGYGAFCEGVFNGQTVGKRAMGIRVVSERGVPISGAQAILRNLVGTVDGLIPFFFQIALASMILTRKFQRLGDLAAGTMVVIEERRWRRGITKISDPEVEALLPWLPGRIAAGSDLARVLSDYVEVEKTVWSAPPCRDGRAAGAAAEKAVRAPGAIFRRRRPLRGLPPDFHGRVNQMRVAERLRRARKSVA